MGNSAFIRGICSYYGAMSALQTLMLYQKQIRDMGNGWGSRYSNN